MERGMSGCSSARSSLEEPFGRRGVQRFLKITRIEITSCSRAVLGLKPGQGSCCRAPRVCRAAGPGGGATGVPHTGQGRASLTGWLGEMLMLCLKVGEQGQGLLLGRFLRMWGWSPRKIWVLGGGTRPCGFLLFHGVQFGEQDSCLDLLENAGCLQSVSSISSCKVSLKCPQRLPCCCLLQILPQFSAFLAGALANVTFLVVPHTGICWLADSKVKVWACEGHQALCSSRLQTRGSLSALAA